MPKANTRLHSSFLQKKNRNLLPSSCLNPAEEGSRTLKVLLPHGPEPCASANSATSAFAVFLTRHTLFYTIFPKCQVFFVFLFSFIFSWLCRSFTVSPVHPSRARFFFFPLFPSPVPADPCPESPLPSVRKQDQADFRPEKQKACLLPETGLSL